MRLLPLPERTMSILKFTQPVDAFDDIHSCLFVGSVGALFRVYCPFRVTCQVTYSPHNVGDLLLVDRIGTSAEYPVLYRINRQYVPHQYFRLLL